jgi:putative ABC transport system ATP-binding protein
MSLVLTLASRNLFQDRLCGKTTLLSILGCMLAPTNGAVRICGTSTGGLRPEELAEIRRQHIGFVFQSYHLFSTLTVAENVRLALDVRGELNATASKAPHLFAQVARGFDLSLVRQTIRNDRNMRTRSSRPLFSTPGDQC